MLEEMLLGGAGYRIEIPNNPIHPCWDGLESDSLKAFNEAQNSIRNWTWRIKSSMLDDEFTNNRALLGNIFISCILHYFRSVQLTMDVMKTKFLLNNIIQQCLSDLDDLNRLCTDVNCICGSLNPHCPLNEVPE